MHDLIIVGGGPAGAAAAIYAARKRLNTLFITQEWGGQSNVSTGIQNWIGTMDISGMDLAKALENHARAYEGEFLKIISPATAKSLASFDDHIEVGLEDGTAHSAKTLLVTTGSSRRKLEIPGAAQFDQKGLTYCASCDGPLFEGQDVAVIGGGNAGFESALQLLAYCRTVTLINRTENFRADEITVAGAKAKPNFHTITNAEMVSIDGDKFVNGLSYKDTLTGETKDLAVTGVFVEIGLIPNTAWLANNVEVTAFNQIKIDPRTQKTSNNRIWAAGDCTDVLYHQNNIAAGDAVKALEDLYLSIHTKI